MERTTKMGTNKTGVQMSPMDLNKMLEAMGEIEGDDSGAAIAAVRTTYIAEAEPVGTVPPPGTIKGAAKTGIQKLTGKNPEVFLNKLGERLAFERSGTRLYDALLTKCQAMENKPSEISIERLMHFRQEEAAHFKLVGDAIEMLGADPTAQTPDADITGVESMGIMQVLDDPRTTLPQCLHAILLAELTDNAGWELLIMLAEDMGQDDMAEDFRVVLEAEQEHLREVRQWYEQCVRNEVT